MKRTLVSAMVLLSALTFGNVGYAANIDRFTRYESELNTYITYFTIDGTIENGDDKLFETLSNGIYQKSVVILNSPGGKTLTSLNIGRMIHKKGYFTIVFDNNMCASACALIWVAGNVRAANSHAKIGFHSSYIANNNQFGEPEVSSGMNAVVGGYLRELGLSDIAIFELTDEKPKSMKWMTTEDFIRLGVNVEVNTTDTGKEHPTWITHMNKNGVWYEKPGELQQQPLPPLPKGFVLDKPNNYTQLQQRPEEPEITDGNREEEAEDTEQEINYNRQYKSFCIEIPFIHSCN